MAILAGIDEAGYGPILGPLVVAACAFELPDALLKKSLWDILSQSLCQQKKDAQSRIIINDSKKLHSKFGDIKHLQRGVLAALACNENKMPGDFKQLLQSLGSFDAKVLAGYPWYRTACYDWPLDIARGDMAIALANLRKDMNENNIAFKGLWARPLLVGQYNKMVDMTDNKAKVLFQLVSQYIYDLWQQFGSDNLQIVCDRQGGRSHYRQPLQQIFPRAEFKIIKETESVSSYQISENPRMMKIHFITKGDSQQLPVALASMTAKYLRELHMMMLNKYFQQYIPNMKPTAGYYQDGMRFIEELRQAKLAKELWPEPILIRQR